MKTDAGNDNHTHFSDFYQPFLIDESHLKGNFTRLGQAVDAILTRHDYPEAVSRLLAEQVVLACMLSGKLDKGGSLTLQVKGSGEHPVNFAVVDVSDTGDIRGYAQLSEQVAYPLALHKPLSLKELLGEKGYMTITMTRNDIGQQYQGVVALQGETLSEVLTQYFTQSEQWQVAMKVAVGKLPDGGKTRWFASGVMIQRLPSEGGKKRAKAEQEDEENWSRSRILMQSVRDNELLDPHLSAQSLLFRLFNEDGVWIYEPKPLRVNCRCSRERIDQVLGTFPAEDLESMKMDGVISVSCEFCNKTEIFCEEDIIRISES